MMRWAIRILLPARLLLVLMGGTAQAEVLHEKEGFPLAVPITIDGAGSWIRPEDRERGEVEWFITVDSLSDAWTIGRGDIVLHDGVSGWPLKDRLFDGSAPNLGAQKSGRAVRLAFPLPPKAGSDGRLRLVIQGGILSWGAGKERDRFRMTIWRGPRAVAKADIDAMGRMFTIDASASHGDIVRYIYDIQGVGTMTTTSPYHAGRLLPGGRVQGSLTIVAKDGGRHTAAFSAVYPGPLAKPPQDLLVGVCIYPEEVLSPDEIVRREAEGKREWEGPYRRERHSPDFYIDKAVEDHLGNLIVVWPEVQKTAGWTADKEASRVRMLADQGIHYMTIYQHMDRATTRRLGDAGRGRFFIGNNLGEAASYMYQPESSAKACRVQQGGNLEECRDWFVRSYMGRMVRDYRPSYDLITSTSGSALAAYELEAGVDLMASELYAIGASNLAYATAEMRGAARKWKPAIWGGWLAHEWQTVGIPYQAAEKFPLLRAGLYQQYLMGSSIIVLESGSQTTQAGFYTAGSGKRNFGYGEDPPTRFRTEMRDFHRHVREHPRDPGLPEVRMALALGHCDSFVGMYIDWLPQWAQYERARKDPNWLYGTPERSWLVAQDVLFPRPRAVGDFPNAWLAGSPFGQVDICQIDRLARPEDLAPYRAIAYAGWNSMHDDIARTLRRYVEDGGRLLLSLPHLSTRLDREYRAYGTADLLGGGDLSTLMPVRITGRRNAAGGIACADPILGMPSPAVLAPLVGEPIAEAVLGTGVRTVCADGNGTPLLVHAARGKGEVFLLLTWEYPGKPTIAAWYAHLLAALAAGERGDVFITDPGRDRPGRDGTDTPFISYAVYPNRIYLLNIDTRHPHTVDLHHGGRTSTITLGPVGFREMAR